MRENKIIIENTSSLFNDLVELPIYFTVRDLSYLYFCLLEEKTSLTMQLKTLEKQNTVENPEIVQTRMESNWRYLRHESIIKHIDLIISMFNSRIYDPTQDVIILSTSDNLSSMLKVTSAKDLVGWFAFDKVYGTDLYWLAVEAVEDKYFGYAALPNSLGKLSQFLSDILNGGIDYKNLSDKFESMKKDILRSLPHYQFIDNFSFDTIHISGAADEPIKLIGSRLYISSSELRKVFIGKKQVSKLVEEIISHIHEVIENE